jgi:hypothetical protein
VARRGRSPAGDRATLRPLGALAQLGERRLCKAEVTGSIPVRSIAILGQVQHFLVARRSGYCANLLQTEDEHQSLVDGAQFVGL